MIKRNLGNYKELKRKRAKEQLAYIMKHAVVTKPEEFKQKFMDLAMKRD